jgi:hypothetical protein
LGTEQIVQAACRGDEQSVELDYTNATGCVRSSKNDLHIVAPRTYLVLKLE